MTIDKAILHINNSSLRAYDPEVADVAIDTMRKYQKIEQILDDCLLDDWEILKSIREVLEDGKV